MDSNPPIITPEDTIFSIDESNKKCVDCGSDKPTMVSVNNGVTLCDACSKIHSEFGKAISYLRPIAGEWDDYLLNFLVLGSNSKFVRTLEVLGVNMQLPPEQKYKTYAVDYYRRNLKAKVIGVKPIDVDYANANDIIQTPVDNYPEFDNYVLKKGEEDNQINSHNINNNSENKEKNEKSEDKTVEEVPQEKMTTGKKIAGFFGKLKNKIKSGGHKTLEGLKKAGTFMEEKTAPARAKIKQGATFVGSQVKSAYEDLKTKIVKNKKSEKEGNAIIVNVDSGENEENKEDEKNKQEKNGDSDTGKEENQEKKETQ